MIAREARRFGFWSCLSVLACSGGDATSPELTADGSVATVDVRPLTITMEVGVIHAARAAVVDAQGLLLDGREITWSVAEPSIASVAADGVVTSLAVGSTTLTATSEGHSGTAQIVVVTSAS